jgi:two-component system, NarL family, response regulator DesR
MNRNPVCAAAAAVRRERDGSDDVIRTLIYSNHVLLRESLHAVLSTELEVTSVGGDDGEALTAAHKIKPEVIVVDLDGPGRHAMRIVRQLVTELPECAVVALTGRHTPHALRQALAAGARGFASRGQPPAELVDLIRRVGGGERMIHPGTALAALAAMNNPLSARERDVLRLAGRGVPTAAIAAELFLSEGTIRNYLSSAVRKMNCANRVQAATFAEEAGWI